MTNTHYSLRLVLLTNLCLTTSLVCPVATVTAQGGQQQGDGSPRQILAEEFTRARPKSNGTSSSGGSRQRTGNPSGVATARHRYKRTATTASNSPAKALDSNPGTPANVVAIPASMAKVGVTIWYLRTPQNAEQGSRLLVQGGEMVPERIASGAVLRAGDRVFLSIESPREGYLYIVDRELFSSGQTGDPYLIFPTTSTRGGDNYVRPGKLINIPDRDDKPNNFILQPLPDRNDQVGELLSVIITSEPLENFTPTSQPLRLTSEQVRKWESQWGGSTEQYDLEGGAGQTQSNAESDAAKMGEGARLLTQEEPPPQTLYLVEGKSIKGLLVNVQLRYRR